MTLNEIYEETDNIPFVAEIIRSSIAYEGVSINILIRKLRELIRKLQLHNATITEFCHNNDILSPRDYLKIFNQCIQVNINELIDCIERLQNGNEPLEDILISCDGILFGLITVWEDRCIEYIQDWIINCLQDKPEIFGNFEIIDVSEYSDEQKLNIEFVHFVWAALRAEKLFFSAERNTSDATRAILEEFLDRRRGFIANSPAYSLQTQSGRSIITGMAGSVIESMNDVDTRDIQSQEDLMEQLGWTAVRNNFGERYFIERGEIHYVRKAPDNLIIHSQFVPLLSQVGNEHVTGAGKYGYGSGNIMQVFQALTGRNNKHKEQQLARLLLQYKLGDSRALTEPRLYEAGLNLPTDASARRTLIARLNKAAYLICFIEVSRRFPQDSLFKDYDIGDTIPVALRDCIIKPQLPFGFAVSCLLMMLSDGILRFDDVFRKDSPYGVFTHDGGMSENFRETLDRFMRLMRLYEHHYLQPEKPAIVFFTQGDYLAIPRPEAFHQLFLATNGGDDESDGEDYNEAELNPTEDSLIARSINLLTQQVCGRGQAPLALF